MTRIGMTKVFFFGSHSDGDDAAFKLLSEISGRVQGEFVKCESPMELEIPRDGNLAVVDVVKGIEDVTLFTDIDKFRKVKSVSAHDLDLGTYLKVLVETGEVKSLKIIGIPHGSDVSEVKGNFLGMLSSQV